MKRKKGSPTISSQVSSFHCETHTQCCFLSLSSALIEDCLLVECGYQRPHVVLLISELVYRFVIIVSSSLFDIYKSYFHFGFKTTLALSLVLNSLIKHKMGLRSMACLFICSLQLCFICVGFFLCFQCLFLIGHQITHLLLRMLLFVQQLIRFYFL